MPCSRDPGSFATQAQVGAGPRGVGGHAAERSMGLEAFSADTPNVTDELAESNPEEVSMPVTVKARGMHVTFPLITN